jgi:hypothetical protein
VTLCLHCKRRKAVYGKRWLCFGCYSDKSVRLLYPSGTARAFDHDPTEAELDTLIAEQSKPENLPKWWESESRRVRELDQITEQSR